MKRLTVMFFLIAAPAGAQEPAPQDQEKVIVVTASPLKPEDVFDVPYAIDVLPAESIQERSARSLPEALKELPGISVQKTSHGHGSPFIRGFTGFRNVLLIDGIRLNHAAFREGPNQYWNTVDPFLVGRLEVLRGPASVLYGSDAIGGTVYVHTRTVERLPKTTTFDARTVLRYSSAERSFTERQEATLADPKGAALLGVTARRFGDVTGGRHTGEQPETGYDEYAGDAKVIVDLGENRSLVVAAQRERQDDVPRTHRTIFAKEWHGTAVGTDRRHDFDQERDLYYAQFRWERMRSVVDSMVLSLSFHRQGEELRRVTSAGNLDVRSFTVRTPGVFARVARDTPAGFVTLGFDYYRDNVDSAGHNRSAGGAETDFDRGEVADDATVDLAGVYVQDEVELVSGLDATAGARYTFQRIEARDVDPSGLGGPSLEPFSETYDALVGSLRLLYRASEDVHLVGGISQGFRAPNLDDTTAVRLVQSGQTDFPNPDLDPEYSLNYELGARVRAGGFEGQLFGFYTALRDFIARVPEPSLGPGAFTKENVSDGWVKGIEFGARYAIDGHWSVRLNAAWTIGNLDAPVAGGFDERPISKLNPAVAHAAVRWQEGEDGPWVEGIVTAVREQDRLSPTDEVDTQRIPPGGTPGYTIATVRGGLRVCPSATLAVAVENVGNRDYRFHGSGQNEPGTNFVVSLDARF